MAKRKRYFQWVAGEDMGEVVTLESMSEFEGEIFYNFDNGDSCNARFISKMTNDVSDLREKFIVEIDSPSNPWIVETIESKSYTDESMKGEYVNIPTLHDMLQANGQTTEITDSDLGKQKMVPPRRTQRMEELPRIEDYLVTPEEPKVEETPKLENVSEKHVVNTSVANDPAQETKTQAVSREEIVTKKTSRLSERKTSSANNLDASDPIRIIVNTCEKHSSDVELLLTMELPAKETYEFVERQFHGGDKFIDYVVDDLDVSEIIRQLKATLKVAYSENNVTENE